MKMKANALKPDRTPETSADTRHSGTPRSRGQALGVWLYAVTRGERHEPNREFPSGVAGETVRLVDARGLTAAVGTVDLHEFGEQALRRKLEDLNWLAAAARAHDHVINALARSTATVPVGLATVFADDDNVRAMLDAQRASFEAALSRLEGRTEWGVKAYADPDIAPTTPTAAAPSTTTTGATATATARLGDAAVTAEEGAGTAFLKRKRAQLAQQRSAAQRSAECADSIHERLDELSVSSRRYAPQSPALTGRREQMLLNGAYLVDDARLDAFRAAVAALDTEARRDGVRVELTGPWPSYSFTAEGLTDE